VRIVIAPDSFGGTASASEAGGAIAEGWSSVRPSDEVVLVPLSDGGEGLLDVMRLLEPSARRTSVEVAGADSKPRVATLHWSDERTVLLESADVCGLATIPADLRRPMEATTYGIGQLLQAAVDAGARTVRVGLGGTATVDGGSGALNGLGFRLLTDAAEGLRIGAGDLHACTAVSDGWMRWPRGDVALELLADVDAVLAEAIPLFGPQKGLSAAQVEALGPAVESWGQLLCATYAAEGAGEHAGAVDPTVPMSGAAGGLGLALAVALGGRLTLGAPWVAERAGLAAAVSSADLVISGEGRLDVTSRRGKVVGHVVDIARSTGTPAALVVGQASADAIRSVGVGEDRVVLAPASAAGPAAQDALRRGGATLARRLTSVD
jgi:glycerate 2-kinase